VKILRELLQGVSDHVEQLATAYEKLQKENMLLRLSAPEADATDIAASMSIGGRIKPARPSAVVGTSRWSIINAHGQSAPSNFTVGEASLAREPSFIKEASDELPLDAISIGGSSNKDNEQGGIEGQKGDDEDHDSELVSVASSLNTLEVFPEWRNVLGENVSRSPESLFQDGMASFFKDSESDASRRDTCVLSPVSFQRICWDLGVVFGLLIESWLTPFSLVFVVAGHMPKPLSRLEDYITIFFCFDILLNLTTGYVDTHAIVLQRDLIMKNYLRSFFWFDLIATIPWDKIVASTHGGMFSLVRVMRVARLLRLLKMVRAVRLVRSMQGKFELLMQPQSRTFVMSMLALFLICLLSHIHACVLAVLQPASSLHTDVSKAMWAYRRSFWVALMAFTNGAPIGATTPALWLFEVFIGMERLAFIAMALLWWLPQELSVRLLTAQLALMREGALNHLKYHNVCFDTPLQLIRHLDETERIQRGQRHFDDLLLKQLPGELARTICQELWGPHLMSMGLIMHVSSWHESFVAELALLVRSESLASKNFLFREGDASEAAYCIIDGRIAVRSSLTMDDIPDFAAGMWVGEKALLSPMFPRTLTAVTKTLSTLMVVLAASFQSVLTKFDLRDQYLELCQKYVWKGVCGRCGLIGSHFANECRTQDRQSRFTATPFRKRLFSFLRAPRLSSWGLVATDDPDTEEGIPQHDGTIGRDLMEFLRSYRLGRLLPVLRNHRITSLQQLEEADLPALQSSIDKASVEHRSHDPLLVSHALSKANIQEYRQRVGHAMMAAITSSGDKMHMFFLSHYKVEAGTEAALMRSDLDQIITEDPTLTGAVFDVPVFLDSEDLSNLKSLQYRVCRSGNLVLLLTQNVLSRPWVLVEIATAFKHEIPIMLVEVHKGGIPFEYPDEKFYTAFQAGLVLDAAGMEVLRNADITLEGAVSALQDAFKRIAIPYSPHRPANIRKAELLTLFKESNTCRGSVVPSNRIFHQ